VPFLTRRTVIASIRKRHSGYVPWRPVLKQVLPWRSLNSAAEIDPKEPFAESCGCKRESHNHWLGMTCYDSLRLNAKLLDERPPFLRVGTLQRAERLGGLPLAGKNLKPEIDQARSHCGIGQRLDGRRI
jgi:hypothetical protein